MIFSLDYEPTHIKLHCTSQVEKDKRLTACKKEPETVRFLEGYSPGVLFDIGSNTGAYALVAAANGHQVYAFEPPGPTFDRLEQNIDLNEDLRVFAYDVLLGDENELVAFTYSSLDPGAALHSLGASGEHVEKLEMRTLDSFIEEHNLPWPDYMKIDTDGSELRVLIGAEETLNHVRALQVEIDDDLPASSHIPHFLGKKGFTVLEWTRHGATPISNVLFAR